MSDGVDDQPVGAMTTGAGFPACHLTLTGLVPLQTEQSGWRSPAGPVLGSVSPAAKVDALPGLT